MKNKLRFWLIEKLGGIPPDHLLARKWKQQAYLKSLLEIRATIAKSDKVFLEPVTLRGDRQTIENCTFLGAPHSDQPLLRLER